MFRFTSVPRGSDFDVRPDQRGGEPTELSPTGGVPAEVSTLDTVRQAAQFLEPTPLRKVSKAVV